MNNLEAQAWNTIHSMYKVWIKRNYGEVQHIGERTYKIVLDKVYRMVLKSFTFHDTLKDYFVCTFTNTEQHSTNALNSALVHLIINVLGVL